MRTAVYVHFPWCLRKCPYCDFATRKIEPNDLPHVAYADAVVAELERRAAKLRNRTLHSVFFGGGTPSLWRAGELGRVLNAIADAFAASSDVEVTVECNPSSLFDDTVGQLVEVGVNRVSIGVQSLKDEHLSFLGRLHDSGRAVDAVRQALQIVPRVSADLMFGLGKQNVDEWRSDVNHLLGLGLHHVSAYALTIEPATMFGALHKKGRLPVATEDSYADMFELAEATFGQAGLRHYEVSNYATAGEESQHNLHYWRGGEYLGLGAAAVGCLYQGVGSAVRYKNSPEPDHYLAGDNRLMEEESLDSQTMIREALMLGLRTQEGVDLDATAKRTGDSPFFGRQKQIDQALERGDLWLEGARMGIPRDRWLRLDGIVANLF